LGKKKRKENPAALSQNGKVSEARKPLHCLSKGRGTVSGKKRDVVTETGFKNAEGNKD